jgi:multidrug transporter EmrE-like cation transporter
MLSGMGFGYIVGISVSEIIGQMLIKRYYEGGGQQKDLYFFFLGWLCYLVVLWFLTRIYRESNFGISNILWNSGTGILGLAVTLFYYNETINFYEWIGVALTFAGFGVLGYNTDAN